MRKFAVLILLFLLATVSTVQAGDDNGTDLQKAIESQHIKADEHAKKMKDLSKKAGKVARSLGAADRNISKLRKRISAQEKVLADLRKREAELRVDYLAMDKKRKAIMDDLRKMLGTLWPLHVRGARARFAGVKSWAELDRRFMWLSSVYGEAQLKLDEARKTSEDLARILEEQKRLEFEAEAQLAAVNKNKDSLLRHRLALRSSLKNIRKKKEDLDTQLQDILSVIKKLNYRLSTQKTKKFEYYKRSLPWPMDGTVVRGFGLKRKPPSRGLYMAAGQNDAVRSIFWGKVVHNDTLRGFGTVVILYHGYNYYSLYAYLSESTVRMGQEVEKDEPIGKAGYCPIANGTGMYFELRFHQKPINPMGWLVSVH